MSAKTQVLARLAGTAGAGVLYMPDLTAWYAWHRDRGSLPERWRNASLPRIAQELGVPTWTVAQPWRIETPGVNAQVDQQDTERVARFETAAGALMARWVLGPDGAWWQTEYPVKSRADLSAVLQLVRARTYVVDRAAAQSLVTEVEEDGVVALELPSRPYTELMQEFLGWGEGLMLLSEEPPEVSEILEVLEEKLQALVRDLAAVPGDVLLSPDNLDGQFVSPGAFAQHLEASYRATAQSRSPGGRPLLVHAGGPIRRLLAPLAAAGVSAVQGIAGPPQGDATLAQARQVAGPALTLWGGIPQELVLGTHPRHEFEQAVAQAAREAAGDARMLLGVSDRVPADADLERLSAVPSLVAAASR